MFTGGIGLWQANELAERAFRLEVLNNAMNAKLIETMARINILKETILSQEQRLQSLQQSMNNTQINVE